MRMGKLAPHPRPLPLKGRGENSLAYSPIRILAYSPIREIRGRIESKSFCHEFYELHELTQIRSFLLSKNLTRE